MATEMTLPPANSDRRQDAIRSLQKLFAAGAMGAFLTALSRNGIHDAASQWEPFTLAHCLNQILRYGYLLWLLAYFFVSTAYHEIQGKLMAPDLRVVVFHVVTWTICMIALYAMGFLERPDHLPPVAKSAMWAIGAITVISGASLLMAKKDRVSINLLRVAGLVWCLLPLILIPVFRANDGTILSLLLLGHLAGLWLLWWLYVRVRIDQKDDPKAGSSPNAAFNASSTRDTATT